MAEMLEEQDSGGFNFERFVDVVRRRHIPLLITLLLGWLVVWGGSWILPPRYKSTTLIMVEQPTMPSNLVRPNINDNLQDRLQSITTQVLSRTRLLLIISKLNLYEGGAAKTTPDAQVALMRKDIDIELVRENPTAQISAFRISYSSGDPRVAQKVTGELTDLFIGENLKARQQQSEGTTQFLESQLQSASASLAEQEAKIRQFQASNAGNLPTQQTSNLQILSGLQSQLENEQNGLNTARQQRAYYESLLEHNSGGVMTSNGTVVDASSTYAIDQELNRLKAKLVDLRSHFTEHHPDVVALKAQIATQEQMRDAAIADAKRKSEAAKNSGDSKDASSAAEISDNPVMSQLRGQMHANQLEIENRERSITDLKSRMSEYQRRLNAEPGTEQQLADLTRGYDQSKQNYDELLKKKNDSQMATNMEQMQQGQRFTMLDPPSLPLRPDFPNRLKFCGIGLAVGLGLGILVIAGLEILDSRLRTEAEIKALLPTGFLAEIPNIVRVSDEHSTKIRTAVGWALTALVLTTIAAGSAFSYLRN